MRTRASIAVTGIMWLCAGASIAQVAWPTNWQLSDGISPGAGIWRPLTFGGGVYADTLDDVNPNPTDIVGGVDHHLNGPYPAGFYYFDATNLMFRMRMEGDPSDDASNPTSFDNFVWGAFFNTDADSDVDYILQLDSSGDNSLEMATATIGGPTNGWDVTAPTPHTFVDDLVFGDAIQYFRVFNATAIDGSHFHTGGATDDYFLDMAVPWTTFWAKTGLSSGDLFSVALASASDHQHYLGNTNKDAPDYSSWGTLIPESNAAPMLIAAGVLVMGLLARRRRPRPHSPAAD